MLKPIFALKFLKQCPDWFNRAFIRGLCQNAYLGDHRILARALGRYKIYLDTRDVAFTPHIIGDGYWELEHTKAMAQMVKRGMTAVDLGANLGYFTLLMSDCVGPTGKVHAFEPNPHMAHILSDTVEINGFASRTKVHQVALSSAAGTTDFHINPTRPMNATLIPRDDHDVVVVPLKRFDDFPELAEADFIKIDVEGAEEAVWQGMANRIANPRPLTIILEFTSDRYKDAGAFVDRFIEAGFALNTIDHRHGVTKVSKDEILAHPGASDQLLVLTR